MDLSIIIVNWNSLEFTKHCIASLDSTIRNLDCEVIVVDNASDDGPYLSEALPSAKIVLSDHNIGFALANNLGVEHARGNKLLFLNPDTLVLRDAIQCMVLRLESAPEVAVVGCRLLNPDLTLQTSCIQRFPNIANQLFGIDWLKHRWPRLPLWGMQALFSENFNGIHDVEGVSGACLMVKRNVFESVGCFSTEYFMYAEEVDLCHKIRRAGWKIRHVGDAQIVHFGGQSTKKRGDAFSDIVMRDSVFKLLRKFRGNTYAHLYRATQFLSAMMRLTILSSVLVLPNGLVNRQAARRAFIKWLNIARWSLALQSWPQGVERPRASGTSAP